jgi:hypothetical protein
MTGRSLTEYRKLMLQLGFRDRVHVELTEMARDFSKPRRRTLAARELAVLHLAKDSPEDLQTALDYFDLALGMEVEPEYLRASMILRAEAHRRLGQGEQARQILRDGLSRDPHLDLHFGLANCAPDLAQSLPQINAGLALAGLAEVTLEDALGGCPYDRLCAHAAPRRDAPEPLISVIMPAYNSAPIIGTAIRSLLGQTWKNIEVLIADDCSTDTTAAVVSEWAEQDDRVRLIRARENGGAYMARNLALREAAGEFVTCNDADDWSHPQKLDLQARHLLANPGCVANDSQQARVTEHLEFYRRGHAGWYTFRNMSSFLFRREPIACEIGFWDCVRFGADSEFINRIDLVFGQGAAVSLETGPVSFQRQSAGSLTAHSAFGYHGYLMGARLEYARQKAQFHQSARVLKYDFPQGQRPFPVPEPMWPQRDRKTGARRFYDVVMIADLRACDARSWAIASEVAAQAAAGLRTGLVQLSRYDTEADAPMADHLRALLDHAGTDVLVHGEKIDCDLAVFRDASTLQEAQVYFPDLNAKAVVAVAEALPREAVALAQAEAAIAGYVEGPVLWCAADPFVRAGLMECLGKQGQPLAVAGPCWGPILPLDVQPAPRALGARRSLGYHRVPGLIAEPAAAQWFLSVFEREGALERQVLSKDPASATVTRSVPQNWGLEHVQDRTVAQFLGQLDLFLCYDPAMEPGRLYAVALEAMAAKVPVILDPKYEPYLGKAALYAPAEAALPQGLALLEAPERYARQQAKGAELIRSQHSALAYAKRLALLRHESVQRLRKRRLPSLSALWGR